MSEVMLGYESSDNISFKGQIETGIERAEWDAKTDAQREEILVDVLISLVQLYVIEDES